MPPKSPRHENKYILDQDVSAATNDSLYPVTSEGIKKTATKSKLRIEPNTASGTVALFCANRIGQKIYRFINIIGNKLKRDQAARNNKKTSTTRYPNRRLSGKNVRSRTFHGRSAQTIKFSPAAICSDKSHIKFDPLKVTKIRPPKYPVIRKLIRERYL